VQKTKSRGLVWLGGLLPEPNGCGPEGLQHLVPNFIFKPACDLHDTLYYAQIDRKASDWAFYMKMRDCIKKERNPLKSLLFEPIALLYYLVVAIGGRWFYKRD